MRLRKAVVVGLALASLTLTGAGGGCAGEGGGPSSTTTRRPAPMADPSVNASVGQNRSSALLHVDWRGYREFSIRWKDQYGTHDIRAKADARERRGVFEVTVTLDLSQPVGISISAGPYRFNTERDGYAHCWIRHAGVIVDEDTVSSGNVICVATNL